MNRTNHMPIRVLQVVPNMQAGGLEAFIMNLYRNIDRKKIQFDFLVHYNEKKFYDDEIETLGGKIYRFSLRDDNNLLKYIYQLDKFYKIHPEYKIVHCHMSSIGFIHFLVAKKNGVKVRIAHSHNTNTEKTVKGFLKSIMIKPLRFISTDNFSCSTEAGKYLYKNKKFDIIPNSIDIDLYRFDVKKRIEKRRELGIDDKLVIGHIGRFELQKNHKYILDILKKVLEYNENVFLLLAGTGSLFEEVKQYAEDIDVIGKVKFLGVVKDTFNLYQAMDCFILPSFFEGLPVVGIEAQVSGLKCFFSDNISKEVNISYLTEFIGIGADDLDIWRDKILNIQHYNREEVYNYIKDTKYNAKITAKWLEEFYISKLGEKIE